MFPSFPNLYLMYKSSLVGPQGSNKVIQLPLETHCAGSWPVAMNIAVTMLAAWALNPPMAPAMAEPTRFLLTLSSESAKTVVFKTWQQQNKTSSYILNNIYWMRCLVWYPKLSAKAKGFPQFFWSFSPLDILLYFLDYLNCDVFMYSVSVISSVFSIL